MRVLRTPLVLIGLLLVVVGVGNWYTGIDKTIEYERLLAAGQPSAPARGLDDFRELDAHTASMLLTTLQQHGEHTIVNVKLDFYKVVRSGGRMLILLGLFCTAAGMIQSWHRRRLAERELAPHHGR